MTEIAASIIIATHNRASYLSRCLNALVAQTFPQESVEVVIVDNNSTDATYQVVESFQAKYPDMTVTYVFEGTPGASLARNRGIEASRAPVCYFLDDDAIATPDWLANMTAGFSDKTVGCVGGPAILDFQGQEPPPWLHGDLQGLLSGFALPYKEPTIISAVGEYPYLCNLAIRRDVLDEVGFFRTDLGPVGNNLVGGEETELMERIRRAGWEVVYLPAARVRHLVSPERLERSYIFRSGRRLAVTHVILTWHTNPVMIARWFASDLWYATRMFCLFVTALLRRKPLWYDDYMRFWMVGMRIPLRARALLRGRESIVTPPV